MANCPGRHHASTKTQKTDKSNFFDPAFAGGRRSPDNQPICHDAASDPDEGRQRHQPGAEKTRLCRRRSFARHARTRRCRRTGCGNAASTAPENASPGAVRRNAVSTKA